VFSGPEAERRAREYAEWVWKSAGRHVVLSTLSQKSLIGGGMVQQERRLRMSLKVSRTWKVFASNPTKWWTISEIIAEMDKGKTAKLRTVRGHILELVRHGLIEQFKSFGAYHYRVSSEVDEVAQHMRGIE
jgi:hypothetical protein